jgi:alpha-tubulin suppressor-like RCC1 family protein
MQCGSDLGPHLCQPVPVAVGGSLRFTDIAAGAQHTCALAGSVAYCWGAGSIGQLGNGATSNSAMPVAVAGQIAFTSISSHGDNSCGIATDGTAWCWGSNDDKQNGVETSASCEADQIPHDCDTTPVQVSGGLHFTAVEAGLTHACGIASDGKVYCWGSNQLGQLGNGSDSLSQSAQPVAVYGTG